MAVTIVLAVVEQLQSTMFATGSVNDEQNTGEVVDVDLTSIPQGQLFITKMIISTTSSPSTAPDLDPEVSIRARLTDDKAVVIEEAYAKVLPVFDDADANGAPSLWGAQFDIPFSTPLLNNRWSLNFRVPPADANATPISNFFLSIVAQHEREG